MPRRQEPGLVGRNARPCRDGALYEQWSCRRRTDRPQLPQPSGGRIAGRPPQTRAGGFGESARRHRRRPPSLRGARLAERRAHAELETSQSATTHASYKRIGRCTRRSNSRGRAGTRQPSDREGGSIDRLLADSRNGAVTPVSRTPAARGRSAAPRADAQTRNGRGGRHRGRITCSQACLPGAFGETSAVAGRTSRVGRRRVRPARSETKAAIAEPPVETAPSATRVDRALRLDDRPLRARSRAPAVPARDTAWVRDPRRCSGRPPPLARCLRRRDADHDHDRRPVRLPPSMGPHGRPTFESLSTQREGRPTSAPLRCTAALAGGQAAAGAKEPHHA